MVIFNEWHNRVQDFFKRGKVLLDKGLITMVQYFSDCSQGNNGLSLVHHGGYLHVLTETTESFKSVFLHP